MLTQEELKNIHTLLLQVTLSYKDSRIVNPLIEKIDSLIEKPEPPVEIIEEKK